MCCICNFAVICISFYATFMPQTRDFNMMNTRILYMTSAARSSVVRDYSDLVLLVFLSCKAEDKNYQHL